MTKKHTCDLILAPINSYTDKLPMKDKNKITEAPSSSLNSSDCNVFIISITSKYFKIMIHAFDLTWTQEAFFNNLRKQL